MANLPTDMELELNLSQRSEPRSPSPQSQLTPCEQVKYNKAQLAKMETFRKFKQENQPNNLENPGSVAFENNPNSHSEENRNNGSTN
ncbi:hypothetical protein TNCV_2717301 [Trichonephila clavipes]|nr:hypothetical protein TNCV_2717301 [Trichonephila clavipes]